MTKRKTPALNPLDMLSKSPRQKVSISDLASSNRKSGNLESDSNILLVKPEACCNWKYHDRPETELGDIKGLAEEFKDPLIGQQQPCIVRSSKQAGYDYEIIVGERRWRAASLACIKLKVIIKEINDEQASLIQIAENFNREDLSDYAQGMSLTRLVNNKILKQKEIAEKFKLSEKQISRLLSFSKVSHEIWEAVGDMSKVSARTASEIRAILKKWPEHKSIILNFSPQIASGKLGANSLLKEIEKELNRTAKKAPKSPLEMVSTKDGKKLFSYKMSKGTDIKISLPKNNNIDLEKIKESIKVEILTQLGLKP